MEEHESGKPIRSPKGYLLNHIPEGHRTAQRDFDPSRGTPEEQQITDLAAESHGREWAERHADLVLEQARAIGHL